MKKILLLVMFAMFSISMNAHEQTNIFQSQFTTSVATQNSATYTSYSIANGGFMQLIYNVFNKVGHVIYSTMHNNDAPTEEEISTEN